MFMCCIVLCACSLLFPPLVTSLGKHQQMDPLLSVQKRNVRLPHATRHGFNHTCGSDDTVVTSADSVKPNVPNSRSWVDNVKMEWMGGTQPAEVEWIVG